MAMYNEITVTAELTNTEYMITKNYNLLQNKPQINSVELIGNKSLEDLGINPDAEENVIDVVKVNGSALTPDANKAVNVTVTTGSDNGTVKVNGSDVAVKGLKSAAFTEATAYDAAGSAAEVQGNVDALTVVVNGKVDKVQGKGLSQNDFTNAYKTKLDGIEAGAQVNTVTSVAGKTGAVTLQKSDVGLGNVDNTSDLNKPISTATQTALDGKVDKVEGKGLSTEDFTEEEKTKLAGIEDGAEVNVQADWNQTDVNADDYIKNKPEIGDAAYAEHLALTTPINNKAPYLFRAVPVRNAFKENLKSIVGGTVAWNQLVKNGNFATNSNWSANRGTVAIANNKGTLTITEAISTNGLLQVYNTELNHIYFCTMSVTSPKSTKCAFFVGGNGGRDFVVNANTRTTSSAVLKATATSNFMLFYCNRNLDLAVGDTCDYENINVIDLTQMFGSTIADYIYSLEQATAGSGVAWLKKYGYFTKPYYAYSANTIQSVNVSAHNTVGFNAYDNSTGKAKLVGGKEYQITGTYTALSYSTGETITPDSNGKFTPTLDGELTITGGNATNTCVHLVWDGERDGDYEAYSEHIYPLDSDLELRGIPKLDANNNLYYDGDTYESDGTVTRKYGVVDLGDLNWTYTGRGTTLRFQTMLPSAKMIENNSIIPNFICSNYETKSWSNIGTEDKFITKQGGDYVVIAIVDSSYTKEQSFKTAVTGTKLIYELATPTTETADTFQSLQIVDDFGTEEFVDNRDVPIPVGNDTDFTQAISIASLPTADGTYNATLTMSNGIATMSFVSTS